MRILLGSILILLSVCVYGQENLVPNGGFEVISSCPWDLGQIGLAPPWTNTDFGSPDLFNSCSQSEHYGVPQNVMGVQSAASGNGYAGFFAIGSFTINPEVREYIQIMLASPLYAGVRYQLCFSVSLADEFGHAVTSLGAFFSAEHIVRQDLFVLDVDPYVENSEDHVFDNKNNWMTYCDTFNTRHGGEIYMLIGNFRRDSLSNITYVDEGSSAYNRNRSYYYIDDVTVIALDSIPNSVEEAERRENAFAVYPNPNSGQMTIDYALTQGETGVVEIFDLLGHRVFVQPLTATEGSRQVSVDGISSGLYILTYRVNGSVKHSERISIIGK